MTNGDNADFTTSPTKPYHGIRIYLNRGNLRFEEAWFFHLNGAYKAIARDFDQDGDLDIAAISFFPDYERSPRESFVYLENQGGLNFTASGLDEADPFGHMQGLPDGVRVPGRACTWREVY